MITFTANSVGYSTFRFDHFLFRRCPSHNGLSTAKEPTAISAANSFHGRYKNWLEKQAKERCYCAELKQMITAAREVGILVKCLRIAPKSPNL